MEGGGNHAQTVSNKNIELCLSISSLSCRWWCQSGLLVSLVSAKIAGIGRSLFELTYFQLDGRI